MAVFLYNVILLAYQGLIHINALWNPKSRKWVNGRKRWRQKMKSTLTPGAKTIWIHAASLGEFEQGRPLLEEIKQKFPEYKIVLTFFSPSGYTMTRDYDKADHVFYLPMDGPKNARDFLEILSPSLAIFIKYEFWYHYYITLKKKNIPTLLVSAAFRKAQPFFQWYGKMFRKMLVGNTALFVQDEKARELLASINITENVFVNGDTRYDRVACIADAVQSIPLVSKFKEGKKLVIAGSTWPADEKILRECMDLLPPDWKLVIAPHEIRPQHIERLQSMYNSDLVLYSSASGQDLSIKRVLVIDNVGLLSSLYAYGEIAFIGGGFQKGGIHNTLEPAVFGLPIVIGPRYSKFVEAVELVRRGFATSIHDSQGAKKKLNELINEDKERIRLHQSIRDFMQENIGATKRVMEYIVSLLP